MADIFTKIQRSEIMSKVRGKDNKSTEQALVKLFMLNKITGWQKQGKIEGNPDFWFPKLKLAVFVDGCFWHKCPKCKRFPKTNKNFWLEKINRNHKRDLKINKLLRSQNYEVVRIWEHELKNKQIIPNRLIKKLNLLSHKLNEKNYINIISVKKTFIINNRSF